ncbi:RNA-guided endonuclease TnpB family protein [Bacillus sp. JJ634]
MEQTPYKTYQIWIKKGHRLFSYFQMMCEHAKNLYNTSNFYYRQVYTALTSNKHPHPLQEEVLQVIHTHVDRMNDIQLQAYQKRVAKEQMKPVDERKEVKANLFTKPTNEHPYINYSFLDCLFKVSKQSDYLSLPIQSSQQVMKTMFQNWKSFFVSLSDYQKNPHKYKGKPGIPNYSSSKVKEVFFTNQDCVIKNDRYLKFPKTKKQLNIGKMARIKGKLKQVRVLPKYGQFVVEVVWECSLPKPTEKEPTHFMGIDLGIDNLATVVANTGMKPVLIKGKRVKSINQYYNKQKAYYTSILCHGKSSNQGQHTSKKLERLHLNRHKQIKDLFHKASRHIVNLALQEQVDIIVIGQNKQWKQESNIGKRNNQQFCFIPHRLLIQMIEYKAIEHGIQVVITEESYTSKASFLDLDFLPTYEKEKTYSFGGKRIKRGLYKSAKGILMNADVNGAYNIIRKVVPNAFANGIEGLNGSQSVNVSTPLVLSVQ